MSAPRADDRYDTAARAGSEARPLKLCFVGEPGVGKSSLVQRLLHDRFPAVSTGPGIRVEALQMKLASGAEVALTVWDVAAASAIDTLSQAYLSGIDAVAGVALAGDAGSAERALALIHQVQRLHPQVEVSLLLNKADLDPAQSSRAEIAPIPSAAVSARDGRGVVDAVAMLLQRATRRA